MSIKLGLVFLVAILVSGCSSYTTNRYAISADNVTALRQFGGKKLSVGSFTASELGDGGGAILCRGAWLIGPPDGQTFAAFIKEAFESDLKIAEVYSASAPVILTGNLDAIDFSSLSGTWNLVLTIHSSNGNSLSVTENYSYTAHWYDDENACNQTAQALMPAVQNLIGKVIRHGEFRTLL